MAPRIVNVFEADTDPGHKGPIFSLGCPDLNCTCLRFSVGRACLYISMPESM